MRQSDFGYGDDIGAHGKRRCFELPRGVGRKCLAVVGRARFQEDLRSRRMTIAALPAQPSSRTDASHRAGSKPAAKTPDRQTPGGLPQRCPELPEAMWLKRAASEYATSIRGKPEHGRARNGVESVARVNLRPCHPVFQDTHCQGTYFGLGLLGIWNPPAPPTHYLGDGQYPSTNPRAFSRRRKGSATGGGSGRMPSATNAERYS